MRTPLAERKLPNYTRGEEIFNSASHFAGCAFGVVVLVLCLIKSIAKNDSVMIISSAFYALSVICLYSCSSLYHGLKNENLKKIFQILDHCAIYFLIVGTLMPMLLVAVIKVNYPIAVGIFIAEWVLLIFIVILTAIDLKAYRIISHVLYIAMGWLIFFGTSAVIKALTSTGFALLIWGGVMYTLGAIIYGIGIKVKYMHNIFHVFCLLGTILHFCCIYLYVLV